MTDVDVDARRLLALRPQGVPIEIPYDDLIVAAGVQQSYFGHDEFAAVRARHEDAGGRTDHPASGVRGVRDGADGRPTQAERQRWLTFALVGAGPTGVELAGQIHELATLTLRNQFRHLDPGDARVLLFDGGTMPLAPFGPKLSARAAKALTGMGVELHMGSIVTAVDAHGIEAKGPDGDDDQRSRPAPSCGRQGWPHRRWRVGSPGPPEPSRTGPGRIKVQPDLTLPGHPEISVVGRHDEPGQAAGRRRGGHADRLLRGAPDPAPGRRTAGRLRSRSGTATSARPPTSPVAALSSRSKPVPRQRLRRLARAGSASISSSSPASATGSAPSSPGPSRSAGSRGGSGRSRCMQIVPGHDVYEPPPGCRHRPRAGPVLIVAGLLARRVAARRGRAAAAAAGTGADGLHADGARHPRPVRSGPAVHHPRDELPRAPPRRRGRHAAGPALVHGDGRPVRGRGGHGHRPQPGVRTALAGTDGQVGRRVRHRVRDRGLGLLPRGHPDRDLHLRLEADEPARPLPRRAAAPARRPWSARSRSCPSTRG